MSLVDLRSDTVTRPTPAMRQAMAAAEVGDDVYGEDPTVRALEEETARLLGQEAAVFVPSGTMANQIGLALLAGPGTEVLVEKDSHVFNFEAGGAAALWGITLRPLAGPRGRITAEQIQSHQKPVDEHLAPLVAVAIENTHNRHGGAVWTPAELEACYTEARRCGLAIHVDGARIWNAAAALDMEPSALLGGVDTVSVCFSKGLGAPVGSALASTRSRVAKARVLRKRLGGGMRQAGIVAAGALYALRHHRRRLLDDHVRAARLGACLRELPEILVLPVESNLVIVDLMRRGRSAPEEAARFRAEGVLVHDVSPSRLRFATHLDVDDAGLDRTMRVARSLWGASR
jgi:threonine aldolase